MSEVARHHRYTFEDYLGIEGASNTKHEFLGGEIYAMGGGTPEHAALAAAIIGSLSRALAGGPCRVYTSDLRIRVLATGLATYPDVSVVCGPLERDPADRNSVTNPALVVEVTSDSTESYDRGEKLAHYQRVPSLGAVLFVSHRSRRLDVVERGTGSAFATRSAGAGETLAIESLGVTVAVDAIYGDVLPPTG